MTLTQSHRGATAQPLEFSELSPISDEDLESLKQTPVGSEVPPLQAIRQIHHKLAWLMAQGYSNVEVAAMCNYSQSRISILKKDPAFLELLDFYGNRSDMMLQDITQLLGDVSIDALTTIQDKIVNDPDSLTIKDLAAVAQMGLDRTGHGPSSTQKTLNVTMSADELRQMKKEAEGVHRGQVKISDRIQTETNSQETRALENKESEVGGVLDISVGQSSEGSDSSTEEGTRIRAEGGETFNLEDLGL